MLTVLAALAFATPPQESPTLREFPQPYGKNAKFAGFKIRGVQAWGWSPERYLAEIPLLAKAKLNFIVSGPRSLHDAFDQGKTTWWEPIPEKRKADFERVVEECAKRDLLFCFSMNPLLSPDRRFDYSSERDFSDLWQHYSWMQGLGVKWFGLCLDEASTVNASGAQSALSHTALANKLLAKLRERDKDAQLVVCPRFSWGMGEQPDSKSYLQTAGNQLHKDVYLFWSGPSSYSANVNREDVEAFKKLAKRRMILLDRYPMNEGRSAMHLGPVIRRDADLYEVLDGYVATAMAPQSEASRIPLLTAADYAWNPRAYDPPRSLEQAILHLENGSERREALTALVKLYRGNLSSGTTEPGFNNLRYEMEICADKDVAQELLDRLKQAIEQVESSFPNAHVTTKKQMRDDLAYLQARFAEKFKRQEPL